LNWYYVVQVAYEKPDNSQLFCSFNPELAEAIDKGTISFIRVLDVNLAHLLSEKWVENSVLKVRDSVK
jgi:hypothetical protein